MKEPMVGSLIYGDHKVPKKSRPWQERWKMPALVGLVFLVGAILAYQFANYRQESSVKEFLADVTSGQLDAAWAKWDIEDGGSYTRNDFLSDWGPDGYYTRGMTSAEVIDSNSRGAAVTVYVAMDNQKVPLALRVNTETLKLSYAPNNKYKVLTTQ
jgi:hypothetical protein